MCNGRGIIGFSRVGSRLHCANGCVFRSFALNMTESERERATKYDIPCWLSGCTHHPRCLPRRRNGAALLHKRAGAITIARTLGSARPSNSRGVHMLTPSQREKCRWQRPLILAAYADTEPNGKMPVVGFWLFAISLFGRCGGRLSRAAGTASALHSCSGTYKASERV